METLIHDYHLNFFILTIIVALLTTLSVIHTTMFVNQLQGKKSIIWLLVASIGLGTGLWCLHFIGMLTLHSYSPISYNLFFVVISFFLSLLFSFIALWKMTRPIDRQVSLVLGAASLAAGITLMHYFGTIAMNIGGAITYQPVIVIISLIVAYTVSYIALKVLFEDIGLRKKNFLCTLIMSVGITGVHFISMAGSNINQVSSPNIIVEELNDNSFILLVIILTVILLSIISTIAVINRRFNLQNIKLRESEENLSLLVNQVNDAIILFNLKEPFSIIQVNKVAIEMLGYTTNEIKGMSLSGMNKDYNQFCNSIERLIAEERISFETVINTKEGRQLSVDYRVSITTYESEKVGFATIRDISRRTRFKDLLEVKKHILEMIARKEPLQPIFDRLVEMIEEQSFGAKASIMLADNNKQKLYHAASNLPEEYIDAVNGIPIMDMSGSCGTAAFRKQTVNNRDLENDDSWSEYRNLIRTLKFQSCYSAPFLSSKGEILGIFALYYDKDQLSPEYLELVEIGCKLCVLAIENKQMEQELLLKTEEKYRVITENMSDLIFLIDSKSGTAEYASPSFEAILGFESEYVINRDPIFLVVQEDQAKITEMRKRVLSTLIPEQSELRVTSAKGTIVYLESKYIPIMENEEVKNLLIVSRDITERKCMQHRMDNEKQNFVDAMKQQHGMTLKFTEQNGKFIYTFADGQLLYNLGFTPEDIVGKDVFEILTDNPCLARTIQDANRRAWIGEENVTYEAFLAGIHYMCTLKPIRRKGKVVEAIVSSIDITERKCIEAALIESEAQHRSLFELSPDAIFIQREDAEILNANPAAAELLGVRDVASLIGRIGYEFIPEEERERVKNVFSNVANSEKKYLPEYQIVTETGDYKHVEAISTGIIYNGEPARQTVLRDVTKRKQAEEALRESEEKYRLITENMHDMIVVTDLTGNIMYISPMYKNMLGISDSDYDSIEFSHFIHEDDQYLIRETVFDVASNHEPQQLEARMCYNDVVVHLEINLLPVINEDESISQLLWVASDKTEKKQKEELLRKTDKLSVVSELAAGVAHEIKNPLTTLKGFVQLIDKNPDKVSDFLPIMHEELERINYITDEFLSLAHPMTMSYAKVEIDELLTSVITLVKARFDNHQVSVKKIVHPDCTTMTCSKDQIKQMLINIVSNSFEAIEEEGTIIIEAKPNGDNHIAFTVTDTGRGIPPERISKLGEPYYSNMEKGTGIGLMVSYKIIQDHKGTINFSSEEGKGTTAEIILPLSQERTVDHLEASISKYNMLTAREKDVLSLIGKGKSNKEIAMELDISESTVKNHITKIFNKLGISDRSQAIVMLYQQEVI